MPQKGCKLDVAIAVLFEMQDERAKKQDATEMSHDKIMDDMYKQLADKKYCFTLDQGAIASRWKRRIKKSPEMKARYEQCSDREAKAKFRAEWAEGEHVAWTKSKVHRVVLSEKQIKEGVYYAVARIAVEEGGGESGERASLHYALYCIQMGPPFVKYHPSTRQIKFLYYVEKYVETFETSWEQHQQFRVAQITKEAEQKQTERGGISGASTNGGAQLCERSGASQGFVCDSFQCLLE